VVRAINNEYERVAEMLLAAVAADRRGRRGALQNVIDRD